MATIQKSHCSVDYREYFIQQEIQELMISESFFKEIAKVFWRLTDDEAQRFCKDVRGVVGLIEQDGMQKVSLYNGKMKQIIRFAFLTEPNTFWRSPCIAKIAYAVVQNNPITPFSCYCIDKKDCLLHFMADDDI